MAFVVKFAKGIRNHWKKSTIAAGGIAYSISYFREKYQWVKIINLLVFTK